MLKETICYEPLYTLTEAEKIIDLQRARRNRTKTRLRVYFIKQKLCGVIMIVLGCAISAIDRTAGMAAIVCIVIGMWLVATRHMVMMFRR